MHDDDRGDNAMMTMKNTQSIISSNVVASRRFCLLRIPANIVYMTSIISAGRMNIVLAVYFSRFKVDTAFEPVSRGAKEWADGIVQRTICNGSPIERWHFTIQGWYKVDTTFVSFEPASIFWRKYAFVQRL